MVTGSKPDGNSNQSSQGTQT